MRRREAVKTLQDAGQPPINLLQLQRQRQIEKCGVTRQDHAASGHPRIGLQGFFIERMAEHKKSQGAGECRTLLPEQHFPGVLTQQPGQRRLRAHDDHTALVKQR